jgi:large subunit ribosomal protein L4
MRVAVRNMAGETVNEVELNDSVFGVEPNEAVMHQALVRQLANARLGTAKAKKRGEVAGGGRKPWAQKGTGHARQGSTRAVNWKGGGKWGAPVPRSYAQKMNRKMRRLALASALSVKVADGRVVVVDQIDMAEAKTREFEGFLQRVNVDSTALVLLSEQNANVELAARNLPWVKTLRATCLSVRDLLGYDFVVMPLGAVDVIHSWLGPGASAVAE